MSRVRPEDVLRLQAPAKGFLCPLNANVYGIDFLSFQIKDYDTKRTIFEVSKDNPPINPDVMDTSGLDEDSYRKIKYDFSVDVLRTPTISTNLCFAVGDNEVEDFRMIERHYFKDQLVKSYDFTFGFCIPCSTNTWEAIYAVPLLEDSLVDEMVACPYETRSDSFYFVNDRLIMHNKAEYKYSLQGAQSKRGAAKAAAKKAKAQAPGFSAKATRNSDIQYSAESKFQAGAKPSF